MAIDRNARRKVFRTLDGFKDRGEFEAEGVFASADAGDIADWLATLPAFTEFEADDLLPHVEKWSAESDESD